MPKGVYDRHIDKRANARIGSNVAKIRKLKGFSQKSFGKAIGRSPSIICAYETGRIQISIGVLGHIAKILDTDIALLMGEIDIDKLLRPNSSQ